MATMELKITFERLIRVWWAYFWRSAIVLVSGALLGTMSGFVVGFVLGSLGVPLTAIRLVTGSIGAFIGLGLSVVPIRMILGKDFGEFRLILVATHPAVPSETASRAAGSIGAPAT